MRLVLDTNVLVSGLLRPHGPPGRLIALWRAGRFALCLSVALLEELREVLARPHLLRAGRLRPEAVEELLQAIAEAALLIDPGEVERLVPEDPDDDHVVATAMAAQAEAIVTGDAHLLGLSLPGGTLIVTPAAMLALLLPDAGGTPRPGG